MKSTCVFYGFGAKDVVLTCPKTLLSCDFLNIELNIVNVENAF